MHRETRKLGGGRGGGNEIILGSACSIADPIEDILPARCKLYQQSRVLIYTHVATSTELYMYIEYILKGTQRLTIPTGPNSIHDALIVPSPIKSYVGVGAPNGIDVNPSGFPEVFWPNNHS